MLFCPEGKRTYTIIMMMIIVIGYYSARLSDHVLSMCRPLSWTVYHCAFQINSQLLGEYTTRADLRSQEQSQSHHHLAPLGKPGFVVDEGTLRTTSLSSANTTRFLTFYSTLGWSPETVYWEPSMSTGSLWTHRYGLKGVVNITCIPSFTQAITLIRSI